MSLSETERAAVQDVVNGLAGRLKLTEMGKAYVDKFARFLLNVDRLKPEAAAGVKRPTCRFPMSVGRWLRHETHRELAGRIRQDGRELKTPDGVMHSRTGQPANDALPI